MADWIEAEIAAQKAREAHPDCTGRRDCPAEDHLLDCNRYRRDLYPRLYERLDLEVLYRRLQEGSFYEDHDNDMWLLGVLRKHLDELPPLQDKS